MRALALLWLLSLPAWGQPAIPAEEYRARRAALRKAVPNGVIVLYGRTDHDFPDLRSGFMQEPNFYYLTGWKEPGAILLMLPADSKPGEILYIPQRNEEAERWTGRKLAPADADAAERTGFATAMASQTFESQFLKRLENGVVVQGLLKDPTTARLKTLLGHRELTDVTKEIARLRMVKSPREIEMIQYSTDVTLEAHRAAWKRARAGLYEFQVAATMGGLYFDKGCTHAYTPIVGSGPNALVLHYAANTRRMDQGELLLMDVGAECAGYATDITRTIPVSGKFTERQREIYEIVLGAQKAALAAVKPGMSIGRRTPNSINQVALEYINTHGKDKHGEPLGKYFIHGLSHHVGLDVHDAQDPAVTLAPGMIITIEPGLYIPEEGIGVRIEDMVLVTETGGKLLSGALPREPDEVEKALAR